VPSFSVRTRLTLWYASVLTLIICVFSTGIFLFVRARLSHDLDTQLGRDLATVDRIYREEPRELTDLDSHWGIMLFQIFAKDTVVYQTDGWERARMRRRTGSSSEPPRDSSCMPATWAS